MEDTRAARQHFLVGLIRAVSLLPSPDKGANYHRLGKCLLATGAGSLADGLHPPSEVPESLWQIPEALP